MERRGPSSRRVGCKGLSRQCEHTTYREKKDKSRHRDPPENDENRISLMRGAQIVADCRSIDFLDRKAQHDSPHKGVL
jgi:hypothetical protein